MRNPEATKVLILEKSGALFNTQGYKATSIRHITDATGFTKGAIYRHFKSKEELEQASLFHLSLVMFDKMRKVIRLQETAGDKLRAIFHYFESYLSEPPVQGGCPLLNSAIEADDAHPLLRGEAIKVLNVLRDSLLSILEKGIKYGQLRGGIDKQYYVTLIIASLEGAIMMSKLRGNGTDIRRVIHHLESLVSEVEL